MRKFYLIILLGLIYLPVLCQQKLVSTLNPLVGIQNNRGSIYEIHIGGGMVGVAIQFYDEYIKGNNVSISSSIRLCYTNPKTGDYECLRAVGLLRGKEFLQSEFDVSYDIYSFGEIPVSTSFLIEFNGIPPSGVSSICIEEPLKRGYYWKDIKINPIYIYQPGSIGGNGDKKDNIHKLIAKTNSPVRGIYEEFNEEFPYQLAFLEHENSKYLVYYSDDIECGTWEVGEFKAELRQSTSPYVYKASWYTDNKQMVNAIVHFDEGFMKVTIGDETYTYIKMADSFGDININKSAEEQWSGTGFAINDGYIATNYHVVENAKSIKIRGIKGELKEYHASVVSTDKLNDLAIIKITDNSFSGFGTIPYRIKTSISEVGENVFVLGYPLITTMGDEIKLTTGVISAKTGFKGDVSLYQISAPIQPGNSGGPLFDNNGNIVGIVSSKHREAENVNYAIKTSYLYNLIETTSSTKLLPTHNAVSEMTLSNKVKSLKNFVFMIICSNKSDDSFLFSSNFKSLGEGNTLNYPSVRSTTTERAKIKSISLTKDYTAVEITSNNKLDDESYNTWCNIDKNTYILVNGVRYTMTKAKGIKIAPEKTNFSYYDQTLTFTLYFPPIPTSATSMDLIESLDSDWKFYGIKIK